MKKLSGLFGLMIFISSCAANPSSSSLPLNFGSVASDKYLAKYNPELTKGTKFVFKNSYESVDEKIDDSLRTLEVLEVNGNKVKVLNPLLKISPKEPLVYESEKDNFYVIMQYPNNLPQKYQYTLIKYEDVTVPAGTFKDAMKLSIKLISRAGVSSVNSSYHYVWLAPNAGYIKSEVVGVDPNTENKFKMTEVLQEIKK